MARRGRQRKYGSRDEMDSSPPRETGRHSGDSLRTVWDSILTNSVVSVTPRSTLYKLANGRSIGVDHLQDRYFPSRPPVMVTPYTVPQWEGVAKTTWFQASTVTTDTVVNSTVGGFVTSLYNSVVRQLAKQKPRLFAIRDTTLANSGTFNSMPGWLNNYMEAFTNLRCLESILAAGGLSFTMMLAANAVGDNLERLAQDMARLRGYSVPQGLIDGLDRLCGVKMISESEPVYICGMSHNTGALVEDITTSAGITPILQLAENNLTALSSGAGGSSGILPADAQAISNVFSYAYGSNRFQPKGVSKDPIEYAMCKYQATSFGITGGNGHTWPNTNNLGIAGTIPIPIPYGVKESECLHQYISLLRPAVYSVDPIAGIANNNAENQVGLMGNLSNNGTNDWGTSFEFYNQAGNATPQKFTAGGFLVNYTTQVVDVLPWGAEAANADTDGSIDRRAHTGYDMCLINFEWLSDATVFLLDKWFLDPLR